MRRFTVLILSLVLLISCNNTNDSSSNNGRNTSLEFCINNENDGLSYTDFDKIYLLCKMFLKEFYHATTSSETMNVAPYLNNDNLKKYILQKIEVGSKVSVNRVKGLTFGVKSVEWHLNEEYMFIDIVVDVEQEIGGFGEKHQFLISNKDRRLSISDWYSKSAGSVSYLDSIVRGDINKIDNPNIWDNKEWVNNIFSVIDKNIKER